MLYSWRRAAGPETGESTGEPKEPGAGMQAVKGRMRRDLFAIALIVAAAVVIGVLQNSVSADPLPLTHRTTPAVAEITAPRQVRERVGAGAVVIDSRSPGQYDTGHIEGALNLPLVDREKLAKQFRGEIPSSSPIIVYCDTGCDTAQRLASWLLTQGWVHVAVFPDGISAWRSAGLPVSTGAEP